MTKKQAHALLAKVAKGVHKKQSDVLAALVKTGDLSVQDARQEGRQNASLREAARQNATVPAQAYARLTGMVKQTETGCWQWQGYVSKTGVASWQIGGKVMSVRRTVYNLAHPTRLANRSVVKNNCDTPQCVHPDCLIKVSRSVLMRNRDPFTTKHRRCIAQAKQKASPLVAQQVAEIRQVQGESLSAIARRYGCSRATVTKIVKGISWQQMSPFTGLGAR